jgi:hypothetical protein
MTEYLADVVMPSTPEPQTDLETEQEIISQSEETDNKIYSDEEEEDITDKFVEPEKKEKIPQEEIFKSAPKVQPVKEPTDPPLKKKRVMTQKQLDALAEARQRGIATRRRGAEEKKKMKELEKEEKQLLKEQKVKRVRKLKEEVVGGVESPAPQVVEKVVEKIVPTGYTQSQLDEAVKKAVEESVSKVEVLRKQRKAKKKEVQAKEQHDARVFADINSALKNDVWAQCFL